MHQHSLNKVITRTNTTKVIYAVKRKILEKLQRLKYNSTH